MKEFAFDLRLFAALRIKAENEHRAREILADIDATSFSVEVAGQIITGECSLDEGSPELFEIDGVPVE